MNKSFYIFRHGETFYTKNKEDYGKEILTADIIEEGKPALKHLANYLKNTKNSYNVSSAIPRCKSTVKIISEITGKNFVFDERLNEYAYESFEEFNNRINDFLNDISKAQQQNIVICTHGACIAALKYLAITKNFSIEQVEDFPDPGVLLIIKGNNIEEINFNLL
ncbi:MAG: histidine phosphatase family protein [Patescibacteria group bacterium]|nr:histidine phosphatase family protein [Patescibacteria group bacterium]